MNIFRRLGLGFGAGTGPATCDYPSPGNVRLGVVYANGLLVGTLVVTNPAPPLPAPDDGKVGLGWWVADDGLVRRKGGFRIKRAGETQIYFADYSPMQNARDGDILDQTFAPTIACTPSDMTGAFTQFDGLRVYFTLADGVPHTFMYKVRVRVKFASGTVIDRTLDVTVQ